ncbi:DUF4097 family beta strand repeat-containing protein [Blautia sp. An249]|uniref:DUF4097 family beta strand repeat-containing protein n=1 Tax=Blautia sp. An249 TaxID=1965603 RepID=UPI0013A61BB1|nr:DUF4097 family beta strand repeat-containing protein [Blautia sp. An249]
MKKTIAFLLVLSAISLFCGCGNIHLRGTVPHYEENIYSASDKVETITIAEKDTPIQIINSNSKLVSVTYYRADDESEYYEITEENGELTIAKQSQPNNGIFILGDRYEDDSYKNVKLVLSLPDNYTGNLFIETMDGDINIGNVDVQDTTVTTNDGDIVVGNAVFEHLQIDTDDGDVSFNRTAIMQELDCKTKDGDVTGTFSGEMTDYSIITKTTGGNSNINSNIGGDKAIEITTKDGDIDILFDK